MEKNFRSLGLVLALAAALAGPAAAATFSSGGISFEVPDGWSAMADSKSGLMAIDPPDDDFNLTVRVFDSEGLGPREAAAQLSREMKGTKPQKADDSPDYQFTAKAGRAELTVTVSAVGSKALAVIEAGDLDKYGLAPFRFVRGTLASADPAEQALFDSLPRVFAGGTMVFELPRGWTAAVDPRDNSIEASSAANDCTVGLLMRSTDEVLSAREVAAAMSADMGGSPPERKDETGLNYGFKLIEEGEELLISVVAYGHKVMISMEHGTGAPCARGVRLIHDSLGSTDPEEQALLNSLTEEPEL